MEIVISVLLGLWIVLAGVLCLINYKKDFASLLSQQKQEEKRK